MSSKVLTEHSCPWNMTDLMSMVVQLTVLVSNPCQETKKYKKQKTKDQKQSQRAWIGVAWHMMIMTMERKKDHSLLALYTCLWFNSDMKQQILTEIPEETHWTSITSAEGISTGNHSQWLGANGEGHKIDCADMPWLEEIVIVLRTHWQAHVEDGQ